MHICRVFRRKRHVTYIHGGTSPPSEEKKIVLIYQALNNFSPDNDIYRYKLLKFDFLLNIRSRSKKNKTVL